MIRWFFAGLALVLGLLAIKKEQATMRFPELRFHLNQNSCPVELYQGWFQELRRLACYPHDFEGRLEGLWGPTRSPRDASP